MRERVVCAHVYLEIDAGEKDGKQDECYGTGS